MLFRSDHDRIRAGLRQPVMIDLRNIYEPQQMRALGYRYVAVGDGVAGEDEIQAMAAIRARRPELKVAAG